MSRSQSFLAISDKVTTRDCDSLDSVEKCTDFKGVVRILKVRQFYVDQKFLYFVFILQVLVPGIDFNEDCMAVATSSTNTG